MKKIIFAIILYALYNSAFAQEIKVEKNIFGIQTGVLGLWGYNELRLKNNLVLRSEIGIQNEVIFNGAFQKWIYLRPVMSLEPRWYYNIEKRETLEKNTLYNSANFLSLKIKFTPDWFVLSSNGAVAPVNSFSFIPTWGIRRNLGQKINYETGIGVGYKYYISNPSYNSDIALNIHLRIGMDFRK